MLISLPFVGVDSHRQHPCAHDEGFECVAVRMLHHPQTELPAFPADHARKRRTVVVKGAMTTRLVGTTPGRIQRGEMETSLLTRLLIHLVGFDDGVGQGRGGKDAPEGALAPDAATA